MRCDCCHVNVRSEGRGRGRIFVDYNGRTYAGWEQLGKAFDLPSSTATDRVKHGVCLRKPLPSVRPCGEAGCTDTARVRGFCQRHYKQHFISRPDPMEGFMPIAQQFCLRPRAQ